MHVLQISPTRGERCGIAYFADDLAARISMPGLMVSTVRSMADAPPAEPDLILVHHHEDLSLDHAIREMRRDFGGPLVVFAHSEHLSRIIDVADAVITMFTLPPECAGVATLTIPHPAWTPNALVPRRALRRTLGLPQDARLVGTCGFLRFDRQLIEVVSALLPHAMSLGWSIRVLSSPWRLDSPGVLEGLEALRAAAPRHLTLRHEYLSHEALNRELQACDLLWCWTREPSAAYASGVASSLYASGSCVVVADKLQHAHLFPLPNVVVASAERRSFVETVAVEMARPELHRHDPEPISWSRQADVIRSFLERLVAGASWCRPKTTL